MVHPNGTIRALKYYGEWKIALEEVADLQLTSPDDVIVDVEYCGICGTDVGIVSGSYPVAVGGVTIGHEATGIGVSGGRRRHERSGRRPGGHQPDPILWRLSNVPHRANQPLRHKFGSESGVSSDGASPTDTAPPRDSFTVSRREPACVPRHSPSHSAVSWPEFTRSNRPP